MSSFGGGTSIPQHFHSVPLLVYNIAMTKLFNCVEALTFHLISLLHVGSFNII